MGKELAIAATAVMVPHSEIAPGNNDRTVFDLDALRELAASLQRDGLKQPITVRPIDVRIVDGRTVRYEIVAGERRWRAAGLAGWSAIPAMIEAMDDETAARIMFLENMNRVDLDAIDEGAVYQKWITRLGWDLDRIVVESGKSRERVQKRLALLKLLPEVQQLIRKKQLPLGHAECMAELNGWSQSQAVKALGNAGRIPNIADFRQMCGELLAAEQQTAMFDLDLWTEAIATGAKRRRNTGLARHPSMPRLVANKNTGQSMLAYIEQLRAAGLESEALVASHILDELIAGNLTTL
ncbi:MAG TPA: ParB/RepB/Spo0J family partition protein [Kouleothrix sp.]|nr:ParB/RepB/Spo0J family partition protein [Kouleothrix sp.]